MDCIERPLGELVSLRTSKNTGSEEFSVWGCWNGLAPGAPVAPRRARGSKDFFILGSLGLERFILKSLEAWPRFWGYGAPWRGLGSKDFILGRLGAGKLILKSLELWPRFWASGGSPAWSGLQGLYFGQGGGGKAHFKILGSLASLLGLRGFLQGFYFG